MRLRSDGVTKRPGTYALILECRRAERIDIGRLGRLAVEPGVYVYIGSAFGPGGLAARIRHHARVSVRPHWHIDHLRAVCPLVEVWFSDAPVRQEHAWASAVSQMPGAVIPLPCFGSFQPAPHPRTVQAWLRKAGVRTTTPRKRDPRRAGGRRWYLHTDVQRFIATLAK